MGVLKICPFCNKEFMTTAMKLNFCSWECRVKHDREKIVKDGKKRCARCLEWKDFSAFGERDSRSIGITSNCKACMSRVSSDRAQKPSGIWNLLRRRKEICSLEDFTKWYLSTPKVCFYCDIPEDVWVIKYRGEGINKRCRRLTIDRVDNKINYIVGNMVFACWHCNTMKHELLTSGEAREIAQKYIKPKWIKTEK